jgi:hypothetical protein
MPMDFQRYAIILIIGMTVLMLVGIVVVWRR